MAKDQNFINALKESGLKPSEISSLADRMIRNIEFFQLSSKINDMFHTFLPVMWDSLKDGEIIFKKGSQNSKNSYTCDINLDLDPLGRLSISVTTVDKEFYITLFAERQETQSLISSSKNVLEKRFSAQGLSLKMVNVGRKDEISFGNLQNQGINLKA
jgi:flagellar hook-length control protein FliK